MIIKFFELNKKNLINYKIYLIYGNNKGLIEEIIENNLKKYLSKNVFNYDELSILNDTDSFKEEIFNNSFFENDKLIIISKVTDKILSLIKEINEKNLENTHFILKSNILEKKSKIRNFFEKGKNTICIPVYEDNLQTLSSIANNFFSENKINISQQNINLLIERSNKDRMNLNNELNKIKIYMQNKKSISLEEILKLTNLAENFSISELVDNSLVKNKKKTLTILNENNFSSDDSILILRIYLSKLKRLLKIQDQLKISNNIDSALSLSKPPIFWKDKDLVKKQILIWSKDKIQKLIEKVNKTELEVKKNPLISVNIITNFIMDQIETTNN